MPSTEEILRSLKHITIDFFPFAIGWHILIYTLILYFFIAKQKPSNRFMGFLSCFSLLSVAVFAWLAKNPFNGILFSLTALFLFLQTLRMPAQSIKYNSSLSIRAAGIFILASGLFYPHFSDNRIIEYFYATPMGLIPCPTLLMIIGFHLIFRIEQNRSWKIGLIIISLFYGVFGFFKLRVTFDIILLIAAFVYVTYFLFD
ncbi:MAG: hypothetical protein ABUT20_11575, partial [Bacteroidota bacterium]